MPYSHKTERRPMRHLIGIRDLDSANWKVTNEMAALGLWTDELHEVEVRLVPLSLACYGWHQGHIHIPRVSGAQLFDLWRGYHTRLTDIIRHEWAHAVADIYPDFVESDRFVRCFGGSHEDSSSVIDYDPGHHVTRYAAVQPCEDFAEVFHFYLRHKGRLPLRLSSRKPVVKKWEFIHRMARRIAAGKCGF
jgi:hypothetical protein